MLLTTIRLNLRHYNISDAAFVLQLLNEPAFLSNIGDRHVRTVEDAVKYIQGRLMASYEKYGYGLYMVETKSGTPVGMCGLVKRTADEDPDVGFAFLSEHRQRGYAYEASIAVLNYARNFLQLKRVLGITVPHNTASVNTLEKLGLRFLRTEVTQETKETVHIYEIEFQE